MARPSRSRKENTSHYQDDFNTDHAPSPDYEYESVSEHMRRSPNHKQLKETQQLQVTRRLNKFHPARYRNVETPLNALQPLDPGASEQNSLARPVSRMQEESTEEFSLIEGSESQQLQRKDDDSGLKLRLDLNLDVEVELKAKIYGDITLSLLK
ncbi:hypothetical protein IFM51744_08756 [Aspergillus udagawae]|nr:hypothetical protein IFM51744_08756 [Aspergillus udagawae]